MLLLAAFALRLALIAYGEHHDRVAAVPYTDVDYNVFTDAARHVLAGRSPYDRLTYRYSPLLAYLLLPNVLLHPLFGKLLFSAVDLLNAALIRAIVRHSMAEKAIAGRNRRSKSVRALHDDRAPNLAMAAWLFNPLTVAIATRGSCDSLAVLLVLATLYLLEVEKRFFAAGLAHGLAVHFRLYPAVYSLAYFMHLSKYAFRSSDRRIARKEPEKRTVFRLGHLAYLVPNPEQVRLVQGAVLSLSSLMALFYALYGRQFLAEAYLYHFTRTDFRHNFSLYFYLQYLSAWIRNVGVWQKVLVLLPQAVLMAVLSVRYGLNKLALNFAVLTLTIVLVVYNGVLTSQYFVWVWGVLPVCLWQIRMGAKSALFLLVVWFAAQGAWLLPAYFLEFHGQNTFLFVWIQGVSFFCANIAILGRMIMYFRPLSDK